MNSLKEAHLRVSYVRLSEELMTHQSQVHLGAEGLEVIELVAERLPLLGLDLCQSDKGVDNQENMECSYLLSMKMRTV